MYEPPLSFVVSVETEHHGHQTALIVGGLGRSCAVETEKRDSLPGKMDICLHTVLIGVRYRYIFLRPDISRRNSIPLPNRLRAGGPQVGCGPVDGAVDRFFDAVRNSLQHSFRPIQGLLPGCCDLDTIGAAGRAFILATANMYTGLPADIVLTEAQSSISSSSTCSIPTSRADAAM